MNIALRRRSGISVQDLLCQNSSETSSCHSPTNNGSEPSSSAAFSSPALSLDQATQRLTNQAVSDLDPTCFSDPETWRHVGIEESTLDAADSPHRRSSPPSVHIQPRPDIVDNRQKSVRGPWRIEEDRLLIELVARYGARHWSAIATHFPRRSGKQARERWMNQLNPNLKKKNWTSNEDRIILRAHSSLGNKWSAIAHLLPGRTDNSVKNRFNSTLKRAMKERCLTSPNFDIHEFVESLHARPYLLNQTLQEAGSPLPMEQVVPTKVSGGTYSSNNSDVRRTWSFEHLNPVRMELNHQPYSRPMDDRKTDVWGRKEAEYRSISQMPRFPDLVGNGRTGNRLTGMYSSGQSPLLPAFNEVLGKSAPFTSKQMDTNAQDYRETSPCTLTLPAIPRHTLIDHEQARIEKTGMTSGHHGTGAPTMHVLSPSKIIAKRGHTRS